MIVHGHVCIWIFLTFKYVNQTRTNIMLFLDCAIILVNQSDNKEPFRHFYIHTSNQTLNQPSQISIRRQFQRI